MPFVLVFIISIIKTLFYLIKHLLCSCESSLLPSQQSRFGYYGLNHSNRLPKRVGGLKWTYENQLIAVAIKMALAILAIALAGWWAQMDSDHRPHAYQACALTS